MDPDATDLARDIHATESHEQPVATRLTTSERVLARVTDGIYRQPGSALRELISNAYDADAEHVYVSTDRPRFSRIVVSDDGRGMTPENVAHLLRNIGGSTKRRREGQEQGLASDDDPDRSPGGRRLIGRIGIGLFSVSQLTQTFQIITKTRGDRFQTVASIIMRQFDDRSVSADSDEPFEAGLVEVWRERASDVDSQGTRIVLDNIRPGARRTLQSYDLWVASDETSRTGGTTRPPTYHVGRLVSEESDDLDRQSDGSYDALPWEAHDDPADAFTKLVNAVWAQTGQQATHPRLENTLDAYLQMAWNLSLAIPATYVDGDPFRIPFGDAAHCFQLSEGLNAKLQPIKLGNDETLASRVDFAPAASTDDFRVRIDDLELSRPLRFTDLPTTTAALKQPILIAASDEQRFDGVPRELSGGTLRFSAYLLWNSKIVPSEHQGVLVRIYGASGTLFDSSFMRWQVAEITRRKQISCEIFIHEGLEGALNIDRESFNYAHPHVVYLTAWLHKALTRLVTVQKRLGTEARNEREKERVTARDAALQQKLETVWSGRGHDEAAAVALDQPGGSPDYPADILVSLAEPASAAEQTRLEVILSILAAYSLLDGLSTADLEALTADLHQTLATIDS